MRQLKISKSITNRDSAALDRYLAEISKTEMITVEEEALLAQKVRNGDESALKALVKANLRFVVSVAKQKRVTKISCQKQFGIAIVSISKQQCITIVTNTSCISIAVRSDCVTQ